MRRGVIESSVSPRVAARIIVLTLLVVFISALPSRAETAEQMLSGCRAVAQAPVNTDQTIMMPQSFEAYACWGAFAVIQKIFSMASAATQKPLFGACLPEDSTRSELIAVFVSYIDSHPQLRSHDFFFAVEAALQKSYPCVQQR